MKICTMYKISHNLVDYPNPPISFRENPHGLRHVNDLSLRGYRTTTKSFLHSFFPSAASMWNALPPDLVHAPFPYFKRVTLITSV